MTLGKLFTDYMTKRGLWPNEAQAVLQMVATRHPEMNGRWEDEREGYPDPLVAAIVLSVRQAALEWIDANKPQHFARPMFTVDAGRPGG